MIKENKEIENLVKLKFYCSSFSCEIEQRLFKSWIKGIQNNVIEGDLSDLATHERENVFQNWKREALKKINKAPKDFEIQDLLARIKIANEEIERVKTCLIQHAKELTAYNNRYKWLRERYKKRAKDFVNREMELKTGCTFSQD